jgi:hypothetical protein
MAKTYHTWNGVETKDRNRGEIEMENRPGGGRPKKSPESRYTQIGVNLNNELIEWLTAEAQRQDRTVSAVSRSAINHYRKCVEMYRKVGSEDRNRG